MNTEATLYMNFNQEKNLIITGTTKGFKIFKINPLECIRSREFSGGVNFVELLANTNILAIVGTGEDSTYPKNKIAIWDEYQEKVVCNIKFLDDILNLKLKNNKLKFFI